MSIDRLFTKTVTVQSQSVAFGGAPTFSTVGTNSGYVRLLDGGERVETNKPELFVTHRVVMTVTVVPVYGQFLLIGSVRYRVKIVDPHALSGGAFQTVDCEVAE